MDIGIGRQATGVGRMNIMHRATRVIAALAAVVLAAGWASAGIEGSKHDFSHEKWSDGQLCSACHTPHRDEAPAAAPLWDPNADLNRRFGQETARAANLSSRGRTSSEGSAGRRDTGRTEVRGSGTAACLRCHDGTVASAAAPKVQGRRSPNVDHAGPLTAGHETSEHPVGVRYPQGDKGFRPVTTVMAKGVPLPDGRVECVSCHDPHNQADTEHMLVTSNARSALCLICHKK